MASSAATPGEALALGVFLTGAEAKGIADRLEDGDTLTAALRAVGPSRRVEARELLEAAGAGRERAVCMLRAIEGARSAATTITPLWTMPGHLARGGPLTNSVPRLIAGARLSITCSTFNFQRTSGLWEALRESAQRPEVSVRVYVDTNAADAGTRSGSPTTEGVAAHLSPAQVLRTKRFDGAIVRNHAKFLAVDHRFLLVTSANFSWSAEHGNVEFGVRIDNPNLVEAVEREMREAEPALYEVVPAG